MAAFFGLLFASVGTQPQPPSRCGLHGVTLRRVAVAIGLCSVRLAAWLAAKHIIRRGATPRVDRKGRTRTGNQGGSFHYPLTGQSSAKLSYLPAKPVFPGRHSFFCLLGSCVEGKSHQSPGGKDWIQTSKQTVSPRLPRSISVPSLNSGPDNPSSGPVSIRTAELTRASIYSPVAATWNRMVAAECRLKRTMLRMTPDAALL